MTLATTIAGGSCSPDSQFFAARSVAFAKLARRKAVLIGHSPRDARANGRGKLVSLEILWGNDLRPNSVDEIDGASDSERMTSSHGTHYKHDFVRRRARSLVSPDDCRLRRRWAQELIGRQIDPVLARERKKRRNMILRDAAISTACCAGTLPTRNSRAVHRYDPRDRIRPPQFSDNRLCRLHGWGVVAIRATNASIE